MPVTDINRFNKGITEWIRENEWPGGETLESIVTVSKVNSSGTILKLHSTFSYFEIDATYHNDTSSLANVHIRTVVPGKPEGTPVSVANLYPVSTKPGEDITLDLGNGVVRGKVSFQLRNVQDSQRSIFVTYDVNVPSAGRLEDTINIGPTAITEYGFTPEKWRLGETVKLPLSEQLDLIKEAFSGSETIVIGSPGRAAKNHKALLVKFSNDDDVSVEAYYLSPTVWPTFPEDLDASESPLPQWRDNEKNIFLEKFELNGIIDRKTSVISAHLYGYVIVQGRTRLAQVKGSLQDGVAVAVNVEAAQGQAAFSLSLLTGKRNLVADVKITLKNTTLPPFAGPMPIFEIV